MRAKSQDTKTPAERVLKDIRRATRKHYSAEDKIRIVLDGLRGEDSIAELCRREGIAQSMYYVWSKEFLEAAKHRLAGDTASAATTDEIKGLRREFTALLHNGGVLRLNFCLPGIDQIYSAIDKVADVSGGNPPSPRSRNGCDLAVRFADRLSGQTPLRSNRGVDIGGV
jgi:transposase